LQPQERKTDRKEESGRKKETTEEAKPDSYHDDGRGGAPPPAVSDAITGNEPNACVTMACLCMSA